MQEIAVKSPYFPKYCSAKSTSATRGLGLGVTIDKCTVVTYMNRINSSFLLQTKNVQNMLILTSGDKSCDDKLKRLLI